MLDRITGPAWQFLKGLDTLTMGLAVGTQLTETKLCVHTKTCYSGQVEELERWLSS